MNSRLHAAGILILISSFFCCFETLLSLCNIRFWFFGPYFQSLLEMRRQLKTHQAIRINLKNSFIPTPPFRLNPIPYIYTLKAPVDGWRKERNPLKTSLREQKYNLKAIMRSDHKSHTGSPCLSL